MRENRLSGSEGGGVNPIAASYPYFIEEQHLPLTSPRWGEMSDIRLLNGAGRLLKFRSINISSLTGR
jgi:hypothetical protein